MPHANFVHLRVHSAYSLAEGAIPIKKLSSLCRFNRMPAVAITDSNNLFGALEFSETARKDGVQPIIGCVLGLRVDTDDDGHGSNGKTPALPKVLLLAQNADGYSNLVRLSSKAFLDTQPPQEPHVDLPTLLAHGEGLLLLTGGLDGPLAALLQNQQIDKAEALLQEFGGVFGGRLYIELQRHGLTEQAAIEPHLLDLADRFALPLVATNDVYFAASDMAEAHEVLLCIAQGTTLDNASRRRMTNQNYFRNSIEMEELFHDIPEAIINTSVIAQRCAILSPCRKPILPAYGVGAEKTEPEILREMAVGGLNERLQTILAMSGTAGLAADEDSYRERLDFELNVIIEMGFAGYFLIVADFIQWAKNNAIPVGPGRGSGAGSVVAWALKITDLDPLRFALLFERFLNPDRVSMPDFDIDFCQDKRDVVIRYVQDRYGHDQVAQIITFGKLQARAVLRDVGRVLGMPYGQVDRITKLVPNNPANPVTLQQAIEGEPRLQAERDDDPQTARLFAIAQQLEGLYRHASTHAAGVVIGDRPLEQLVPLYRDPRSDMPVTQFNMKWVEQAGLVKFDFLGLKTLTVLDRAAALIRNQPDHAKFDLDAIPLDDPATYEMLQRGDAIGVFQFEGSGMRDLLREAEPTNIEDLIALVALYRPGPMENIPKYIACKHGREQPEFLHDTITPVVKDTYGVIIYQEQVMQIAQVFAGYSLGQADLLRRAMGKKIKAEMAAQRDTFVAGAMARGVDKKRANYVFDLVDKFAGYGFNKAHSAGYALVAYQTAYLKANFPVAFMAASMTLDMGNTEKLAVFRQELNRMNIPLLPPDINRSDAVFSVEQLVGKDGEPDQGAVRYALAAVKNVGRDAMQLMTEERKLNGLFSDLWDFAARMDAKLINKRQIENLIRAGAFDSLFTNRAQLLANTETLLKYAQLVKSEQESLQTSLFADAANGGRPPSPPLQTVESWPQTQLLSEELQAVGFYLSAHPLDSWQELLKKRGVVSSHEAMERAKRGGTGFLLAGTVMGRQERRSAKGNKFAFLQLSDSSGMFEVMVFSDLLAEARSLMEVGQSLIIAVEIRADADASRMSAQKLTPLETFADSACNGLRIFLSEPQPLPAIRSLLERTTKQGHGQVSLVVQLKDRKTEVDFMLPGTYFVDQSLRAAMRGLPGVIEVHDA